MKTRHSRSAEFREDYWLNPMDYRPDAPGIQLHSFCHSFLTPQWHPNAKRRQYIQVSMILSGQAEYINSDGDRISNQPNFFRISDLNQADPNVTYTHKNTLERYFILLHVNRLLRSVLNELFPGGLPRFMPSVPERLKSCFEDIRRTLRRKGPPDNAMLGALVFRLLTEAAAQNTAGSRIRETLSTAQNTAGSRIRETLSTALRYIDNQFCDPALTRDQVAAAAGISVVALGKLFRSGLGTTPGKYITSMRLEKARHLLEFSELPVAQIAEQCGFSTNSYFTKVFRSHLGRTPLEYRQGRMTARKQKTAGDD